MGLQALLCPCSLQYKIGKIIGLYQCPGKDSTDICTDCVMTFAVFGFPLMIYATLIAGIWIDGMWSLAGVVWAGFVTVGATHRMSVRRKYGLKGSFSTDVVSYFCCHC